jgi:uncharacterized membrane protein YphA (DoxX/SURF4 family)
MRNDSTSQDDSCTWESTASFLVLRCFLAFLAIMNGISKFEGKGGGFSFEAYVNNAKNLAKGIADGSFLSLGMCQMFAMPLGIILLLLGLAILTGFFMRVALTASGLLYSGLAFGLMASKSSPGVAWLAIYVGLTVMALNLSKFNRFQINRL